MARSRVTVLICQSCIQTNGQSDPLFDDAGRVHAFAASRLRRRWWHRPIRFHFVDCLGNCRNNNSVQIDRKDGSLLFGWVNDESSLEALLDLSRRLDDLSIPLASVTGPADHLVEYIPPTDWKTLNAKK